MDNALLPQFLTLSLYVVFMGFCFCDGFKLHITRKLLWFTVFLIVSFYTIRAKGSFELALILPIPTAAAIMLCAYEKRRSTKMKKE
ncbi:hypothetical protein ACFL3N_03405 [Candidatus Omnitrophota bacterium]